MNDTGNMKISYDEWMAEMEAHRTANALTKRVAFTPEMDEALLRLRQGPAPVPWPNIVDGWKKRYGWGNKDNLLARYRKLLAERGDV